MSETAFLRYSALGLDGDVVRAMDRSYRGFKTIYDHLKGTQQYLQRPENVASAYWRFPSEEALNDLTADYTPPSGSSVWVELLEPENGSDHDVRLFERFFDDYTNAVVVISDDESSGWRGTRFARERRIAVLDRVPDRRMLLLEAEPEGEGLEVRPNTYVIDRQLAALRTLQNEPQPEHLPLLRLVQDVDASHWPDLDGPDDIDWQVLTDVSKPGVEEQRRFVEKALATPDFALLEGPPGSGKTTIICELIVQLVLRGNRVMLCGSTHVAVDNVLERLTAEGAEFASHVLAVRIGDRGKCSERVRHLRLDDRVETERRHLLGYLGNIEQPTLAQETLHQLLLDGSRDRVQRLVLDVANVVCGTTIGILQHPDIRSSSPGSGRALFDVLIVDEASKTTLQEFLVPAVLARRWVLVGDVRQLSPHVDEEELQAALEPAVRTAPLEAQIGVDLLRLRRTRGLRAVAVEEDSEIVDAYTQRAMALGIPVTRCDSGELSEVAGVVVCDVKAWKKLARADGVVRRAEVDDAAAADWSAEVAWRLSTRFQQRLLLVSGDRDRFDEDLRYLIPDAVGSAGDITAMVDRLERVAMPSILESLQHGYGTTGPRDARTALTEGLPERALDQRYEKLRYQYRMHPEISAFPRTEIYDNEALRDAAHLDEERSWTYNRYPKRVTWLDVRSTAQDDSKRNDAEVGCILEELHAFAQWVCTGAQHTEQQRRWSVAVICFYREQERALRRALRKTTGQHSSARYFDLGDRNHRIQLALCTVDGFQGQEADLVLLSIALPRTTAFTRSLNRVNVALTRARYQLVVVGNRAQIRRERASLLQSLAERAPATLTWEPR